MVDATGMQISGVSPAVVAGTVTRTGTACSYTVVRSVVFTYDSTTLMVDLNWDVVLVVHTVPVKVMVTADFLGRVKARGATDSGCAVADTASTTGSYLALNTREHDGTEQHAVRPAVTHVGYSGAG